jgi:NADH:ubiquinone reductase (H+-translocating)
MNPSLPPDCPRVVIVGGGFAGLAAARALRKAPCRILLVDQRNHHLFQPLLYQVAAATLAGPDIASPIRHILRRQRNLEVRLAQVARVDPAARRLLLTRGDALDYDFLILAPGARHSYFGQDGWADLAPGLKTLEDALEIRRRFLLSFERAEAEPDPPRRAELLTYVIVGGGPTGVELAGTLQEMARLTLPREFRKIRADRARVVLVEAGARILPTFGEGLSERARRSLERIGVEVRTGEAVTELDAHGVTVGGERIPAATILWAAGVQASPLGRDLGAPLDRAGRVRVEADLSLPGHPEILVAGDLASFSHGLVAPLPGLGPVAVQEGRAAARAVLASLRQAPRAPFRYRDRGAMATIGRGSAILQWGRLRGSGFLAWLAWLFIHLMLLVGYRNRLAVLTEWCFAYLSTQRRARLILAVQERDPGRIPET